MATRGTTSSFMTFSLLAFLLLHGCVAQLELPQSGWWHNLREQQQHRLRAKTDCRVQRIDAREPEQRYEFEGGYVEYWDGNNEESECAGIRFVRHVIQPGGLLLPHYANAPQLVYVVQGNGVQGVVIPGCAETFESGESSEGRREGGPRWESERGRGEGGRRWESERGQSEGGRRWEGGEGGSQRDRHQKLRRIRQGDVLALPQGVTRWTYNDGDSELVTVSILDVANDNNQLDLNFRKFFLAGNPSSSGRQEGRREGRQEGRHEGRRFGGREERSDEWRNIFSGFDEELLADAFNVDNQLIRRLQSQDDNRGFIVKAERLNLVLPEYSREEREEEFRHGGGRREQEWRHGGTRREQERRHGGTRREQEWRHGGGRDSSNGLEETFCTLKLHQSIDNPERADIFNPRAGRISTVNSQTLPVLSYLRLNAERGILYRNALTAPKYSANAHSALYVTRGNARIQVVGNEGNAVFDGEVREGQLLIIPQNFAVVKRASEEGFEWINFQTNDNAFNTKLAGRLSAIRSIPADVLANAYDISREEALKLKYNRRESTLFSSESSEEGRYRPRDAEAKA
ncbi:hypothetical protein M569_03772 [Genlisea aurea]|uniref:Cupin type-1 domain-containing protein n=1 Tax=Genlisea aurea TaxID=192259 RepID=S8CUE0_9LAMI|nr:hypothetical protein M569_03772 [Genlisea aurea]